MKVRAKSSQVFGRVSFLPVAAALCCLLPAGCGSGTYQSAPVNADVARETLEHVMESWKGGDTVEALKEQSPAIVVQDIDWTNGAELLSYEVVGDGKEANANLIAQVKLTLKDKEGTQSEKMVTYVVGTAPVLTVFRDMLH